MAPRNKSESRKPSKGTKSDGPQLLPRVLEVLGNMKESVGFTTHQIVTHLQSILKDSSKHGNGKSPKIVVEVRRALRHGVDTGLLKQHAGRYVISTKASKSDGTTEHATRGRPKNKKQRKRKRSPTPSSTSGETDSSKYRDSVSSMTDESTRSASKGQRRKRKQRGRRRKRQPRRKQKKDSSESSRSVSGENKGKGRSEEKKEPPDSNSNNPASSDPSNQQQQQDDAELPTTSYSYYRRHKNLRKSHRDYNNKQMDEDAICVDQNNEEGSTPECGNPDVLGNLNKEPGKSSSETELQQLQDEPECPVEKVNNDYIN